MTSNTIRVGIIGTGNRGITCIGRQIAAQRKELDITITALCNRTEVRMQVALEDLNEASIAVGNKPFSPNLYSDPKDLINDDEVDIIVITTAT
ncbi:uncharacterized protein METZ01_LOCUS492165, partial [marine metagenome]